jgi:hypothetical protein
MNEFGRLSGVFFEPAKVFADVSARPRFIAPLLIGILIALSFTYAISTHIGWDMTIRQSLANSSRADSLTPAQRETAVERGAKFAGIIGWIGAVAGPPLFMLLIAGILTGLFNALLGTDVKFAQGFAITAYAFLVRGLYTLLLILIMFLKPPEDFNIQVSPFSPAAYMSRQDNPKWLMSLAGSLDLFTFWVIILLAIGFSVAAKKLSFSKALTAIAIPWLVWVVALMAIQSFQ